MSAPGRTPALLPAVTRLPVAAPSPLAANHAGRHLWLCIGLPALALEVCADTDPARPLAIVDGADTRSVVHVVNACARQHGVRTGLGLNAAYALCPALQTRARDTALERRELERLARWAERFTPWVSLVEPAALLLEVRGSLGLFGGTAALCVTVERELEALQRQCRVALAPTPLAALWLARASRRAIVTETAALPGQLGALSLHCLQWPPKITAALIGMGVRTIGDCLRLPREGFARRFGRQRLGELDRALGRAPDPRTAYVAPARFCRSLDLPAETDDRAQLLEGAGRLITALGAFLLARQGSVQRFWLRFFHPDAPATCLRVGMLEHCRDPQRLQALLATRMERVGLPAPVVAIELRSGLVTTAVAGERDLFRCGSAGEWSQLLESLCARLGARAVRALSIVPEHRPEAAWRYHTPAEALPAPAAVTTAQRPLWLLPQPQRLCLRDGRPECGGALVRESGPERIESGWWDSADVARDYYIARNAQGLRLWIYRERRMPDAWYLHGYFG